MIHRHHAEITTVHVHADGRVADRFTAGGQPLNWGRTKRFFTTAQRDVYLALHAGCTADGCDRPLAWTAIDHTLEWTAGGRTNLDNGRPLCDWHNLSKEHHRTGRLPKHRERPDTPAGPDP